MAGMPKCISSLTIKVFIFYLQGSQKKVDLTYILLFRYVSKMANFSFPSGEYKKLTVLEDNWTLFSSSSMCLTNILALKEIFLWKKNTSSFNKEIACTA